MRGFARSLVLVACISVAALLLGGCAGSRARDSVGVPSLQLSVPAMQKAATCGVARLPAEDQANASADVKAFFDALATTDQHKPNTTDVVAAYHLHWAGTRRACLACLEWRRDSGEIGPDVYTSLTTNVLAFEDTLKVMAHEPVTPRSP